MKTATKSEVKAAAQTLLDPLLAEMRREMDELKAQVIAETAARKQQDGEVAEYLRKQQQVLMQLHGQLDRFNKTRIEIGHELAEMRSLKINTTEALKEVQAHQARVSARLDRISQMHGKILAKVAEQES